MNESGHDDVIAVLTRDHRHVQALFDEMDETRYSADPKQRKAQTDKVAMELDRHSTAEEQFLYPVVRITVAGGGELADREAREHAQLERDLRELESMPAGDTAFEPTLQHLNELVKEHITEQEQILFPRLQAVCSTEDLVEIGEMVLADKKAAPARHMPGVSGSPGAPDAIGAPEPHGPGLVGRIRDAFSGHGHRP